MVMMRRLMVTSEVIDGDDEVIDGNSNTVTQ